MLTLSQLLMVSSAFPGFGIPGPMVEYVYRETLLSRRLRTMPGEVSPPTKCFCTQSECQSDPLAQTSMSTKRATDS